METYDSRGEGWILFAGIMLMILGFLNFVYGIAAIDGSSFFTDEGRYVIFTDLNTWGWVLLIIGICQLIASFSVWSHHVYGRIIGVLTASVSALTILFTVNAYPFAAFMVFLLDVMVIYALIVYGGNERSSA